MSYKKILQNMMTEVDNVKDKLDDNTYLTLTDGIQKLFLEKENNLYEIIFLTSKFTHVDVNVYIAVPKKYTQIIKMTEEEYTELKKVLSKSKNFAQLCCNMILSGIVERLISRKNIELVGQYHPNDTDDDEPINNETEMTVLPKVVVVGCKKL